MYLDVLFLPFTGTMAKLGSASGRAPTRTRLEACREGTTPTPTPPPPRQINHSPKSPLTTAAEPPQILLSPLPSQRDPARLQAGKIKPEPPSVRASACLVISVTQPNPGTLAEASAMRAVYLSTVTLPLFTGRKRTGSETLMGLNWNLHPKQSAESLKKETETMGLSKIWMGSTWETMQPPGW